MRTLLIQRPEPALVLRDVETPVQEVLDRAFVAVVADRARVDESPEAAGLVRMKDVVARPGGLGDERDAEHLPGAVEKAPARDLAGILVGGFGFCRFGHHDQSST